MINTEVSKKEKVIATAIKLIVANGFNKVSTAGISNISGVATGTMFHHFSSKDDIIITAYKTVKRSFIAQTANHQNENNVKEDLQSMWIDLIEWSLIHQDEFRYMQQFLNSPYYSKEVMSQDDTWTSLLAWWKAAIKTGQIKDIPVEFLIKMFSSVLYSTIDFLITYPEKKEEYLKCSFSMCWDMVGVDQ
ncbi:transcriptional regulator, TetR family [Mucilaginibacter mallensis]|uniref:Transcriptional regulator, TetR family n=1 Tax=Mucilaginibacter mallensis TaxID=652787 RepID=A0A1H2CDA1_MUCMA|nr:TetR/AcrR family transcriptional regulator [Mucilaginibacter mallensis]SDT68500.1 transcriptional regulator, TetR family [Mucilaginibacter mallensis]